MAYPNIGKVKTVTLPCNEISISNPISCAEYLKRYGVDLRKVFTLIKTAENKLYFFVKPNTFLLLQNMVIAKKSSADYPVNISMLAVDVVTTVNFTYTDELKELDIEGGSEDGDHVLSLRIKWAEVPTPDNWFETGLIYSNEI